MRVFVLGTGRCGSVTFAKACSHITNYSAGHESRSRSTGSGRFEFPENHIEADNRLAWFTGPLDKRYGDEAFYVHLQRDRDKTARSFLKRFSYRGSIIQAYAEGIKMTLPESIGKEKRLEICYDYVDTVNGNIHFLLKNKSKKMEVHLETIKDDFVKFWKLIDAEGDLNAAVNELDIKNNPTKKGLKINLKYMLWYPVLRVWRRMTL